MEHSFLVREYVDYVSYILAEPTEVDVEYCFMYLDKLTNVLKEYVEKCKSIKE